MKTLLLSAFLLLSISCFSQKWSAPVSSLVQDDEQKKFLESVFHLRQRVDVYEDSVMRASGFRSEAHLLAIDSLHFMDSALAFSIDDFLSRYGYPAAARYGDLANRTPLMILGMSRDTSLRKHNFSILLSAYRDGEIPQRTFMEYLENEYSLRTRKRFKSYAREEARIRELMRALNYHRKI